MISKTQTLALVFLIFCLGTPTFAQVSNLDINQNVVEGPYLELTDDGYNVYTWTSKAGFLANKIGKGMTHGAEPVTVEILQINRFDNAGAHTGQENHPVRLGSSATSGLGKYVVTEEKPPKSTEPFARESDPSKREILDQFPNSDHHSGKGVTAEKAQLERIAKLYGKGLLGMKKPYTLSFSDTDGNTGKLVSSSTMEVTLKDIPTDNSNAEWKASGGSIILGAHEPVVYPALYSKWVKKEKFSHYMNFKLVSYDNTGKMIGEKNMSFDKPYQLNESLDVIGAGGKRSGMLYSFKQVYGLGWKKVNPTPDKTLMHFVQLDENFKVTGEFDYDFAGDSAADLMPSTLACFHSNDAIKVYAKVSGSKKSGIKSGINQYTITNGEMSKNKFIDINGISVNTPGVKKFGLRNLGEFQDQFVLENGDLILMGRKKVAASGTVPASYGQIYYMRTTPDGEIKSMGIIDRGTSSSAKDPSMSLENLDETRALIRINNNNGSVYNWIYSVAEGTFELLAPPTGFQTETSIRRDGYIYYIGKESVESPQWQVVKLKI